MKCLLVFILGTLLLSTGGDAQEGLDFVSKVCSECHAIHVGQPFSPRLDAPRFEDIAYSSVTANMLIVLLRSSHPTMPDIMMSDTEVANIVEYILSMKRE